MAGIYIHVPFCVKKCAYCDFFSIGILSKREEYPELVVKELLLRKSFISDGTIQTIYFGGGTPSLLSTAQIDLIINSIAKTFNISENPEITIEVNPDDLSREILLGYRNIGVNRLSIGTQSFIDDELTFLGRRHNAARAEDSISLALQSGFDNLSVDLIYGIPGSTEESWEFNLDKVFELDIKHLSCYHLTFEEGTLLTRRLKEKRVEEVDERTSLNQFNLLRSHANINGFVHYEVSNFAKQGYISRHNTSYWKGIQYLGLGPAAHSFNGVKREWCPTSYDLWKKGVELGVPELQGEVIDKSTQFNEILLTQLRTIWGIDLVDLQSRFSKQLVDQLISNAEKYLKRNELVIKDNSLFIPQEHFFISDRIIGDLIIVD